jgi:hypothetical protein
MTGNADEPPKPAPPIDAQREQMVDALTSTERNLLLLAQSASMLISGLAGGKPDAVNPAVAQHKTRLDQRRQALLAMPHEQLRAMYQQQLATDREHQRQAVEAKAAKRQKQADAKEAARFYNQASASADFDFWTKHEYWTFEEALALLLGKNPEVVTAARVRRELTDAAMIVNSCRSMSGCASSPSGQPPWQALSSNQPQWSHGRNLRACACLMDSRAYSRPPLRNRAMRLSRSQASRTGLRSERSTRRQSMRHS